MRTHLVDVHDDVQCSRAYAVIVASKKFGRPWSRPPSLEESVLEWRHVDKAEPMEMWAAKEDGEVLGIASIWLPQEDNTSMVWFEVQVDPGHRRRGAGSALMQRLVERATEERRTRLVTDTLVPVGSEGHPHRRYLEKHGFTLSNTEIMRHLALPVPEKLLTGLAEQVRPGYEGVYRLETHVDGVPEEQRASLTAVMNQLGVDAPTGDIEFEPETLDPARYAEHLELERDQGRTRLTTVAVHEQTGDVVAYTDLIVPAGAPDVVWQGGTLVHKDHRGHRLGMAVKVENLRRLRDDHPGRERIVTGNDDTNRWMVEINERLGFAVVELCPAYQRRLT